MGWFGLGNVVSSIGNAFSSAVSRIGSGLSSFATGVATVIGTAIETFAPIAKAIGTVANALLQGLGILKPNENIENMGDRALQAADAGITMDEFKDFDSYMDVLRNFEPDPDKSKSYSSAQKIVAGLGVGTAGMEKKFDAEPGSLGSVWLLPMANPEYFNADRLQSMLSNGHFNGDAFAYLEKRLTGGESRSFEKNMEVAADGKVMNVDERSELYQALEQAQDNWSAMMDKLDGNN